jgi:hypothetical protein
MTNNGSTPHYAYLIVGGGMAAHAAIKGIRGVDPEGSIGLISFDRHPPYRRPPLSKGLWKGESLNASVMGECAGRVMAHQRLGQPAEAYQHLPCLYSELFDQRFEAVGQVDTRLKAVTYWSRPSVGVSYYLADHQVRGVLLWNLPGQIGAARELIAEQGPVAAAELKDRLPLVTSADPANSRVS